jgi:hypothetical protein
MVMYKIFIGFEKYRISSQNSNVLTFDFIEKRESLTKTDRNSVFLGIIEHIPD